MGLDQDTDFRIDHEFMMDELMKQEPCGCEVQGFHKETGQWVTIAKSTRSLTEVRNRLFRAFSHRKAGHMMLEPVEDVLVCLDHFSMLRAV